MFTDWLVAAGIVGKLFEKLSRMSEYNPSDCEAGAFERMKELLCQGDAEKVSLCGMLHMGYICISEPEYKRIAHEFFKTEPTPIPLSLCKPSESNEKKIYGNLTVNEFLELRPETIRFGWGDNVFVQTNITQTRISDLKFCGDGHCVLYEPNNPYSTLPQNISWTDCTCRMEPDVKWAVRNEIAPCSCSDFLELYFKFARKDIVILRNETPPFYEQSVKLGLYRGYIPSYLAKRLE